MRTTLNLKDDILKQAQDLTKIKEKTKLIHEGLLALIEKYSKKKLILLGGSEKKVKNIKRRR